MKVEINFDKNFEDTIIEKHILHNDTYVAFLQGSRMTTLNNLYNELESSLQLPSYFGRNWNALDECLNDFSWLPHKKIVIAINEFEKVLSEFEFDEKARSNELEIFLDCLQSAVNESNGIVKVYILENNVAYELI